MTIISQAIIDQQYFDSSFSRFFIVIWPVKYLSPVQQSMHIFPGRRFDDPIKNVYRTSQGWH